MIVLRAGDRRLAFRPRRFSWAMLGAACYPSVLFYGSVEHRSVISFYKFLVVAQYMSLGLPCHNTSRVAARNHTALE